MKRVLKQLTALVARTDKNEEMLKRIAELADQLVSLTAARAPRGETLNPIKLLQIHLKYVLFNSDIKGMHQSILWRNIVFENIGGLMLSPLDGDNIKTFLNGLEDCSAVKSDEDDSIYVFLANYATELWYVTARY